MRKIIMLVIAITILCCSHGYVKNSTELSIGAQKEFNRLNWVEVAHTSLSTQIMFDFAQPIYVQKKLITGQSKLELSFPGMKAHAFNKDHVIAEISKLKVNGLLEHVEIQEKDTPPMLVLTLTFASQRTITSSNDQQKQKTIKNKLLIKWSKIEDNSCNRLILDIFLQEILETMQKKENPIILQAQNTTISDVTPQKPILLSTRPENFQKKNFRIVIDSGHGGLDTGSISPHNAHLKEKDITLAIARKTRRHLKKLGYNVLLTRNADTTLSLAERSEFADQMKADLLVSIHVNAHYYANSRDPSGIETYYLYAQNLLRQPNQRGFFFINQSKKEKYIKLVDQLLEKTASTSKQLATSIQAKLINFLRDKKLMIIDRGVKGDLFRLLLRSSVPCALVEVGFLTHQEEAQRLATHKYQNFIAKGISLGIQNYVTNNLFS